MFAPRRRDGPKGQASAPVRKLEREECSPHHALTVVALAAATDSRLGLSGASLSVLRMTDVLGDYVIRVLG
ncbi:hypothetical protein ACFPRL_31630 [Pseudoclavibacter helvolus]